MAQRVLKRATNLDGVTYLPGEKVDDEVFTNPKLFEAPEASDDSDGDDDGDGDDEPKAAAKKSASSSA